MFIKTSKMRVKNFITRHILQVIKKRRLKIISNILKLNLITLRRYIGLLLLFIFQLPEMTCSVKYFRACKWIVRLGIIINNFFFCHICKIPKSNDKEERDKMLLCCRLSWGKLQVQQNELAS